MQRILPTELKRLASLVLLLTSGLLLTSLPGCWVFKSADEEAAVDEEGSEAEIENPEGDTSVAAKDGGPGFKGEGWTTVKPYALGDPKAVKGGQIVSDHIYSWPATLRIVGLQSNTYLNSVTDELCYESLCEVDENTLEFLPRLATHWKIEEDNTVFTFRINPRAHWSDGRPVTAEDVIATYDLIADETLIDPMAYEVLVKRVERPEKLSKYIVRFKSKKPFWRNFVTVAGLSILPAHQIRAVTLKANGLEPEENAETDEEFVEEPEFASTEDDAGTFVPMEDRVPLIAPRPDDVLKAAEVKVALETDTSKTTKESVGLKDLMDLPNKPGKVFLKTFNDRLTVVSGPYQFARGGVVRDESLTFQRRKNYWNKESEFLKGRYNFDRLKFVVITDPQLAFKKALNRELDFYAVYTSQYWVEELTDAKLKQMKLGHLVKQKVYTDFPTGTQGMAFNMRKAPLDDVRIRKAIAHVYDRATMVEKFAFNEYELQKSYFSKSPGENPDNEFVEYDLNKAAALLDEAGWTERNASGIRTKNGRKLSFEIMYRSPVFEKYLAVLKEAGKQVGIELNLRQVDPTQHWKTVTEDRDYEIASMAWGSILFTDPKPNWHSDLAEKNGSNNITGFANPEVDDLIDQYDREFDLEKRNELLQKIDALVFEQHPYALDWYAPSERILYWNKFGMPKTVLPRYADWRSVYTYWWVDPAKEKALLQAISQGTKLKKPREIVKPFGED